MASPFQLTPEQAAAERANFAKPTEVGATMWNSNLPGELYYSPTGEDWQLLNPQNLADATTWAAVQRGANAPSAAQGAFQNLIGMAPTSIQGQTAGPAAGSSHSLAPEIIDKMWR